MRHVYTCVMPDGSELMVERFVDANGTETGVFAATRETPDTHVVWGPPTRMTRR
jgi:hypothetical protein